MAGERDLPYWLEGGAEICEACEQPYTVETERRCAACDAALCAQCARTEPGRRDVRCGRCDAAPGDER